jgi:hypothetical protein
MCVNGYKLVDEDEGDGASSCYNVYQLPSPVRIPFSHCVSAVGRQVETTYGLQQVPFLVCEHVE